MRITDDPNAKEIRINEDDLYKTIFTEKYDDVLSEAKRKFSDFKQGREFNSLMKQIKKDPSLYKLRYLEEGNPKSLTKPYFSKKIYDELAKHYQLKTD